MGVHARQSGIAGRAGGPTTRHRPCRRLPSTSLPAARERRADRWCRRCFVLRFPGVVVGRLASGAHLGQLSFLPAAAAFGEDALEEDGGGLVVAALGAGQLRLRRNQPALDSRLQHRGPIPLQVALHPLQRRHGVIEPSEVGLDASTIRRCSPWAAGGTRKLRHLFASRCWIPSGRRSIARGPWQSFAKNDGERIRRRRVRPITRSGGRRATGRTTAALGRVRGEICNLGALPPRDPTCQRCLNGCPPRPERPNRSLASGEEHHLDGARRVTLTTSTLTNPRIAAHDLRRISIRELIAGR